MKKLPKWMKITLILGVLALMAWRLGVLILSPAGLYLYAGVATTPRSYLELQQGQVELVTPASRRSLGGYFKSEETWVWVGLDGKTNDLFWSLSGLKAVESNDYSKSLEFPRLFIRPGLFSWGEQE